MAGVVSGGPVSELWLASPAAAAARVGWVWVSYFGQDGGGVADVLLGAYSPSARLPFTMPYDTTQVGPITDYDMRSPLYGRTYRYLALPLDNGFTQLDDVELVGALITGGPGCDDASVPGQCCYPKATAAASCSAWGACAGFVCNPGRSDCQARGAPLVQAPGPFTSFIKDANGTGATPLFPFAFGKSYANISIGGVTVVGVGNGRGGAAGGVSGAALGATVTLSAQVVNTASASPVDFSVALFGEFLTCDGGASPVPALPRRTLVALSKVLGVGSGLAVNATLSFALDEVHIPGVERQAFPGVFRLWAGDGGRCVACPQALLPLVRGNVGCSGSGSSGKAGGEL